MNFTKQNKATDSYKIDLVDSDTVYASIKYDGIYLQIHKKDNECKIYLSSGKEVNIPSIKALILSSVQDSEIVLECEYVLGNSRSAADNEIKALVKDSSLVHTGIIYVFDVVNEDTFQNRRSPLTDNGDLFVYGIDYDNKKICLVPHMKTTIKNSRDMLHHFVNDGEEGLMLKYPFHKQKEGKKSKLAIKLKPLNIADLTIVEILDNNYIALVDENEITAKVKMNSTTIELCKVGGMIEIAFDFIGKAYNQARFRDFRFDKEVA